MDSDYLPATQKFYGVDGLYSGEKFYYTPIVFHYRGGVGKAIAYKRSHKTTPSGTTIQHETWQVQFNSGITDWINKKALKILTY